jgi:hypothetical protein
MSTFDDDQLAARFAALAPEPLPGEWEGVFGHAGAARHGRRRVLALAAPALAVATAIALFVSTPWQSSPGFLEKAQAALVANPATILHYKSQSTTTSQSPQCTVTSGSNEIWIDQASPHRYRAIARGFDLDDCSSRPPSEFAGELDSPRGGVIVFEPPSTLRAEPMRRVVLPIDPVSILRGAISAGWAHHEGRTMLDGRMVERIRIDPPPNCLGPACPRKAHYTYVDPETFYPVQEEYEGYIVGPGHRFTVVDRTLTFEYLPRTLENLALTDIRAQHPDAKGP